MVHLHCGWPKTGTTSLQAALTANQRRLADIGLLYPEKWRRDVDGSHNDLIDLLEARIERGSGFGELTDFLIGEEGRDVLFSGEILTQWLLLGDHKFEAVLDLVAAMQTAMPVRCVWTLRRLEDVLHSMFRQMALRNGLGESKLAWLLDILKVEQLLPRMRELEAAVDGDVAYVRYEPSGEHFPELLEALGIRDRVAETLGEELGRRPRLNVTPTQKQIVVAENIGAVEARAEIELDRVAVRGAVKKEGLSFQEDSPCVLLTPDVRRQLHETVLDSARSCGFTFYERFFGDEDLDDLAPTSSLEADVLSEEDIATLVTHFSSAPHEHDAGEGSETEAA